MANTNSNHHHAVAYAGQGNTHRAVYKFMTVAVFVLTAALSVNANAISLWGWQGSIVYLDDYGLPAILNQAGGSQSQCDQRQNDDLQSLTGAGHTIIGVNECSPNVVHIDIDKLRVPVERVPIPDPGPVCLSCPFLTKELIKEVYPTRVSEVYELMQKHGVFEYNRQLQVLQKNFDLEGFETEMYRLQTEQMIPQSDKGYK